MASSHLEHRGVGHHPRPQPLRPLKLPAPAPPPPLENKDDGVVVNETTDGPDQQETDLVLIRVIVQAHPVLLQRQQVIFFHLDGETDGSKRCCAGGEKEEMLYRICWSVFSHICTSLHTVHESPRTAAHMTAGPAHRRDARETLMLLVGG